MDLNDITPQLDQLDQDLDQAKEVLKPLLGDLGDLSSKLPLLDKAKLYVLATYAIESLLFCESRSCALLDITLTRFSSHPTLEWGGHKGAFHPHRVDPC
jgi:hypothetical protein